MGSRAKGVPLKHERRESTKPLPALTMPAEGLTINSDNHPPVLGSSRDSALLRAFFDAGDLPFFIKDENLRYLFVNAKFSQTFGKDRLQLVGKTDTDWRDDDVAKQSIALESKVLQSDIGAASIEYLKVLDGSTRAFKIQRFPLSGPGGRLLLGGIAFDINAEIKTESHMREKSELLELILNNIGDPVIAVDENGALLLFNPAAIKLHGLDNAKGKYGLFMPDRETRYDQSQLPLARAIKGEEVHDLEIFVRTPYDWEGITVSASAQPLRDKTGKLRGGAAVLRDITVRKKAEEALLKARDEALAASELKSQFVSNISHELRTPMSGVLGLTELLLEMKLAPEQHELAQYIYESAQSLLKVVNDLLDFSKLEAGKLHIDKTVVDVRQMIEECATAQLEHVSRRRLSISHQVDPDIPRQLLGDGLRSRQVLTNLIGNAVKFTEKGRIEITASIKRLFEGGMVVRFTVSDTGIGVPAHMLEKLFQPFVQADGSNTRKYGGVGLGLSICRRLVKLMSGDIGVTSVEGQGSNFWFEIPLEAHDGRIENDSRS